VKLEKTKVIILKEKATHVKEKQEKETIEKITWKMVHLQPRVMDPPYAPKMHRAPKQKIIMK